MAPGYTGSPGARGDVRSLPYCVPLLRRAVPYCGPQRGSRIVFHVRPGWVHGGALHHFSGELHITFMFLEPTK